MSVVCTRTDLGELLEDRVPLRVGELARGELYQGDPQAPHVAPHLERTVRQDQV